MQQRVVDQLGGVARPSRVYVVNALPKTRSGKLLRRSLQALAEQRDPGDLSKLDDPGALDDIRRALEHGPEQGCWFSVPQPEKGRVCAPQETDRTRVG